MRDYRHTADGQWVANVNLMSVYFVDGCLLPHTHGQSRRPDEGIG